MGQRGRLTLIVSELLALAQELAPDDPSVPTPGAG
jgi:hypothetical protein